MHNLRSISVSRLFGRYNYVLPASTQLLDDVNILYGENGAGKTTVLNLVFHLLSPADNAGHRTKISEIPFLQLEVALHDGTKLTAKKDPQLLVGPVEFKITPPIGKATTWRFVPGTSPSFNLDDLPSSIDVQRLPNEMRQQVSRALDQRRYFEELRKLNVTVFMLTSDRILMGDSVRDTLRPDPRPDHPRARARLADIVLEHRIAAVSDALNAASSWVRSKFLERTYGPNESSANLYLDVARKIAKSTYRTKTGLNPTQEAKTIAALTQSVADLDTRAAEFQRFGLSVSAASTDLLSIIQEVKGNRLQLISTILEPHLASLKARYDSLQPLYSLVNTFVSTLNRFLKDKQVQYSVRSGFRIIGKPTLSQTQEISPAQLSSGEQQLLLLFCHVLNTRDNPNIFIIDEPEISLNIIWQRMLVASILDIAKGSRLQLVLASHSMEIIAKHRDRVVSMQES